MTNKLKEISPTWKLVIFAGALLTGLIVCLIIGGATYLLVGLRQTPTIQVAEVTVAPVAPKTQNLYTATPNANTQQTQSAIPTATPPGSEITDPNYIQAKAAYLAEDYTEVLRLSTLVIEVDPNLAPAYWYRGMAHFYTQDFEAGLQDMERALEIDPDYALGYADRGLMFIMLGDETRAFADWEKALSLDPTLAKVYHNYGAVYNNKGDYANALTAYAQSVSIDPERAETWSNLAQAQQNMGQFVDCIDSASQALSRQPDIWISHYMRGSCHANLGQYTQAVEDLNIYIDAEPGDPKGWYNRGLSHRLSGNDEQALADYNQAIILDPSFSNAYINRGNIYIDMEEFQLALDDYNAALNYSRSPRALLGRGDAYAGLDDPEAAITTYLNALQEWPGYDGAYVRLSNIYMVQGDYQGAIDAADNALALSPNLQDTAFTLQVRARAYYELENYTQAIDDLTDVINMRPARTTYYYRGLAYEANGQNAEAIADYQVFLSQGGEDQERIDEVQSRLSRLKP